MSEAFRAEHINRRITGNQIHMPGNKFVLLIMQPDFAVTLGDIVDSRVGIINISIVPFRTDSE